jgi:hypothetical protein
VSLPVANERGEPGIKPTPQQWNEYTTEFLLEQLQVMVPVSHSPCLRLCYGLSLTRT